MFKFTRLFAFVVEEELCEVKVHILTRISITLSKDVYTEVTHVPVAILAPSEKLFFFCFLQTTQGVEYRSGHAKSGTAL